MFQHYNCFNCRVTKKRLFSIIHNTFVAENILCIIVLVLDIAKEKSSKTFW